MLILFSFFRLVGPIHHGGNGKSMYWIFLHFSSVDSILRYNATFYAITRRFFRLFDASIAHGARTRGNYHQTEIRLLEGPSPTKGEICQRDISPPQRSKTAELLHAAGYNFDRCDPLASNKRLESRSKSEAKEPCALPVPMPLSAVASRRPDW